MKKKKKFLFGLIVFIFFILVFSPIVLAEETTAPKTGAFVNQEKIPGQKQRDNLIDYLNDLYTFGIAIAGILAVVMISLGAFSYIVTAGGNSSKILDAKDMITEAIFGLILALAAYLLLFVLNPDLIGGTVQAPTNVINSTTSE